MRLDMYEMSEKQNIDWRISDGKSYCREWSRQTGYPLHYIKNAKHFANGDNPEQVNAEIALFINNIIGEDENDLL